MSTIREMIVNDIVYLLEQVPVAGKAVEIIQNVVLAPDHWEEIRSDAEALVNKKISQAVFSSMVANLQGLSNNLTEYVEATNTSKNNPAYIGEKFNVAKGDFNQQVPSYQIQDQRVLLLPLFAQMANMHLTLLRDGAVFSDQWGFTREVQKSLKQELIQTIDRYGKYVKTTYGEGLSVAVAQPGTNVDQFNAKYGYIREMTLNVLEYAELWPAFDISQPQQPSSMIDFDREIYSDAFGSSYAVLKPLQIPTNNITLIKIWEESMGWPQGRRIDTLQVQYGNKMGPKMGGAGAIPGGHRPGTGVPNSRYWKERTLDLKKKIITRYAVATFAAANVPRNISGLELTFDDGTNAAFGVMEARDLQPDVKSFPVISGYYMSSITMVEAGPAPHRPASGIGALIHYEWARAIFFGFKRNRERHTIAPSLVYAHGDPGNGTYLIQVVADRHHLHANDLGDKLVSTRAQDISDDYTLFILERQADGTYRIKVVADNLYWHANDKGNNDKLVSTRAQPNDDYTRFRFVYFPQKQAYRIYVLADNRYLHANDLDDKLVSTRAQPDDDYTYFYLLRH
jgi:hypothetical protein